MALHAAANIAMAIDNFKERNYAQLGGIILNRRNVKNELEKVKELCLDISGKIVGTLDRDELVTDAEQLHKTVIEAFPNSKMALEYTILASSLMQACGEKV
jgi:nitrogenase iron protein NifH